MQCNQNTVYLNREISLLKQQSDFVQVFSKHKAKIQEFKLRSNFQTRNIQYTWSSGGKCSELRRLRANAIQKDSELRVNFARFRGSERIFNLDTCSQPVSYNKNKLKHHIYSVNYEKASVAQGDDRYSRDLSESRKVYEKLN